MNTILFNIKKLFLPLTAVFSSIILLLILGFIFLGWFVSSIDGEMDIGKINVSSEYYIDYDSRSIMERRDSTWYRILVEDVDSLGSQGNLIYGFANQNYYMLNTTTDKVMTFQTKDSLGLIAVPELKSIEDYRRQMKLILTSESQ